MLSFFLQRFLFCLFLIQICCGIVQANAETLRGLYRITWNDNNESGNQDAGTMQITLNPEEHNYQLVHTITNECDAWLGYYMDATTGALELAFRRQGHRGGSDRHAGPVPRIKTTVSSVMAGLESVCMAPAASDVYTDMNIIGSDSPLVIHETGAFGGFGLEQLSVTTDTADETQLLLFEWRVNPEQPSEQCLEQQQQETERQLPGQKRKRKQDASEVPVKKQKLGMGGSEGQPIGSIYDFLTMAFAVHQTGSSAGVFQCFMFPSLIDVPGQVLSMSEAPSINCNGSVHFELTVLSGSAGNIQIDVFFLVDNPLPEKIVVSRTDCSVTVYQLQSDQLSEADKERVQVVSDQGEEDKVDPVVDGSMTEEDDSLGTDCWQQLGKVSGSAWGGVQWMLWGKWLNDRLTPLLIQGIYSKTLTTF